MSIETNKGLIAKLYEAVNARRLDTVEALTGEMTERDPLVVDAPAGKGSFRAGLEMAYGSFPDMEVVLDEMIAEGDKVMAYLTIKANNTGDYRRGHATGRGGEWPLITIYRFEGETIVESYGISDRLGALQQLGIVGDDDALAKGRQ